ncbi:MAG: hypothetical protein U5Q03_01845 [Bacteroidota bacterium]|nr:hypothetical protein [Bacteroidota bacterium]
MSRHSSSTRPFTTAAGEYYTFQAPQPILLKGGTESLPDLRTAEEKHKKPDLKM